MRFSRFGMFKAIVRGPMQDPGPMTHKLLGFLPPARPPADRRRPPPTARPTAADRPADHPIPQKKTFGEVKIAFGMLTLFWQCYF